MHPGGHAYSDVNFDRTLPSASVSVVDPHIASMAQRYETTAAWLLHEWPDERPKHFVRAQRAFGYRVHDVESLLPDDHQRRLLRTALAIRVAVDTRCDWLKPMLEGSPLPEDRPGVHHDVVPLVCARCHTDKRGRGEFGLIGRSSCRENNLLVVLTWRDGKGGRGSVVRHSPSAGDEFIMPECRKCGSRPRVNVRVLGRLVRAKLWIGSTPNRGPMITRTPQPPYQVLLSSSGRFELRDDAQPFGIAAWRSGSQSRPAAWAPAR